MIKLAFKEENKCSKERASGSLWYSAIVIQGSFKGLWFSQGKEKKQVVLLFHVLMSSDAVLELGCIRFQGSFAWFRINSCWINFYFFFFIGG